MGDGKENRSRKKPVRIVVKSVYVGSKSMADVFGGGRGSGKYQAEDK